jgi:hypothetical protein
LIFLWSFLLLCVFTVAICEQRVRQLLSFSMCGGTLSYLFLNLGTRD